MIPPINTNQVLGDLSAALNLAIIRVVSKSDELKEETKHLRGILDTFCEELIKGGASREEAEEFLGLDKLN